jgi:hypothetical protein
MKILQYLHQGQGRLFGDKKESICIETATEIVCHWKQIEQLVLQALAGGEALGELAKGDVVLASAGDGEELPDDLRALVRGFNSKWVGCHGRALEDEFLIAPPAIWPIDLEARFALMELDVMLTHIVDADMFMSVVTPRGQIIRVPTDDATWEDGFVVRAIPESGGEPQEINISSRFFQLVLYGFATIDSVAQVMIELASKATSRFAGVVEDNKPSVKPAVEVVRNLDEAHRLWTRSKLGEGPSPDYVLLPEELWKRFMKARKPHGDE